MLPMAHEFLSSEFFALCIAYCDLGSGSHTQDRVYTRYTHPSYDRLFSCQSTGAREACLSTLHANSCSERTRIFSQTSVLKGTKVLP